MPWGILRHFAAALILVGSAISQTVSTYGKGCESSLTYIRTPKISNDAASPFMSWVWTKLSRAPGVHVLGVPSRPPLPTWPGCHWYVDPIVMVPVQTDSSGHIVFSMVFTPSMYGLKVHEQFHVCDGVRCYSTNAGVWRVGL